MQAKELSIVTIRDGVPSVLRNPLAGLSSLDEWREAARKISTSNPPDFNKVVFLMEEDGEYPLYRYVRGKETNWRKRSVCERIDAALDTLVNRHSTLNMDEHIRLLYDIRDVLGDEE